MTPKNQESSALGESEAEYEKTMMVALKNPGLRVCWEMPDPLK